MWKSLIGYYFFLELSLFIALFLYSDDYNFPWSRHEEGLKYLYLISVVPVLLLFSLGATYDTNDLGKNQRYRRYLLLLVFICLPVYMGIDGGSLGETKLLIGAILTVAVFILSIILLTYELFTINLRSKGN
jgi:hypothetical protein